MATSAFNPSLGKGRPLRQKMFDTNLLYYSTRPVNAVAALATSYVWPVGFTGSQALALHTQLPTTIQTPPFTANLTLSQAQNAVYFYMPCIPGQQYTTSAYWRMAGGNSAIRMSITGGVLNQNPYFTTTSQITDWTTFQSSIIWVQGPSRATFGSMKITPQGGVTPVDAHSSALNAVGQSDLYTASAWVYSPNGWSDVRAGINWFDANGSLLSQGFAATATAVPAGVWTQVTYTSVPNISAASAQLRVRMGNTPSTTDILYVDEATLVPANKIINGSYSDELYSWQRPSITFTATAAQHTLTIGTAPYVNANPTFETGIQGWSVQAACYISQSSDFAHSGTYSMMVVPDGSGGVAQAFGEKILIPFGATDWVVSMWIYSPKGYSNIVPSVSFFDSNGTLVTNQSPAAGIAIPAAEWTNITFNCSGPSPTRHTTGLGGVIQYAAIRVRQGGTPTSTDTFYVDDAYLAYAPSNSMSAVYVDALQHEVGNAVSTWSSTGPSIYGIFGGFVERWPSNWNYQGTYGLAQITGVDAFAVMANRTLDTELVNQIKTYGPQYYWRLNEGSTSTSFADSSGNQGPNLVKMDSKSGPASTFAPGTATNIPGDPSGTGIQFAETPPAGSCIQTGWANTSTILFADTTANWSACFTLVVTLTNANGVLVRLAKPGASPLAAVYHRLDMSTTSGGTITLTSFSTSLGFSTSASATLGTLVDGKPHFITCRLTVASNFFTQDIYVDNNFVASNTVNATTTFGSATPDLRVTCIEVAGRYENGINSDAPYQGTYSHIGLWNFLLDAGFVSGLVAGFDGWGNLFTSSNLGRYLAYKFVARSAIESVVSGGSAGSLYTPTIQGVSTLAEGTALLDACQAVNLSENGNLFVDPNGGGVITFQNRYHRYAETTAKWVFGENAAAGEIPYNGDIAFDFDPTQVYNDVEITRSGGIVAVGGTATDIAASQLKYGQRSYTATINVADDDTAQDAANWIFSGHKAPHQRLQQLVINPAANPSLWPAALGIRISDRVTVKRRTSAGFTMSADFFIERIEHTRGPGEWTVTYQMSPFAATAQPAFFDSSLYGRFDTAGSQLEVAIGTADTSMTVSSSTNTSQVIALTDLWTMDTVQFPFTVTVDSEQVTVTAITDSLLDKFNRTVSSNWGTPDNGPTWSVSPAAQFSVSPGAALVTANALSTIYAATSNVTTVDFDITVYGWVASQVPTGGGNWTYSIVGRQVDANNYVHARVFNSGGTSTVAIRQVVGGVENFFGFPSVTGATATTPVNVRFQAIGTTIQMKVWLSNQPEPTAWTASMQTTLLSAGNFAVRSEISGTITNTLPILFTISNVTMQNPQIFTITRGSASASHAVGAPVNVTNAFRLAY